MYCTRCYWYGVPLFFSSRRRHTRWPRDWSSDVCSSDLNWIAMYASDWFQESTHEMIELMDDLADKAGEDEKEKIVEQFVIAKEYELAFWEMSHTFEKWLSERE